MIKIPTALSGIVIGCLLAFVFSLSQWANFINFKTHDFLLRHTAPVPTVNTTCVIGIDESSLTRYDTPLVLWHQYLARSIMGAVNGGARGIALDIIPSVSLAKIAPELDRTLILAMTYAKSHQVPLFLGFSPGENGNQPHKKFLLFSGTPPGLINVSQDADGLIRKQILVQSGNGNHAYSLAWLLANIGEPLSEKWLNAPLYIDFRLDQPEVFSLADVNDWEQKEDLQKLKQAFGGKYVFIGVTSPRLPDMHYIPGTRKDKGRVKIPGVLIQAMTTKTLLAGNRLYTLPFSVIVCLALVLGICSGLGCLYLSPQRSTAMIIIWLLLSFSIVWILFSRFIIVKPAPLIMFILVCALVSSGLRYFLEFRQSRDVRRFFKSYVNEEILQQILTNPAKISFKGEKRTLSIMFVDIRNFSTICEEMDPGDVLTGLNQYFKEMTRAITGVKGYVNRYVGDGILALFGAPNRMEGDGAWEAVQAGMIMLERLETLNRKGVFPGVDQVKIGIGIHTGEAIVGNVGCHDKMAYDVTGDAANLAARIESQTKIQNVSLLVSENTHGRIRNRVKSRFVTSTKVKGRHQNVNLYEILSLNFEPKKKTRSEP